MTFGDLAKPAKIVRSAAWSKEKIDNVPIKAGRGEAARDEWISIECFAGDMNKQILEKDCRLALAHLSPTAALAQESDRRSDHLPSCLVAWLA